MHACNIPEGIATAILFTAAFRTFQKHASNIIEIHTLRELHDFWETQKL
ncbi:MAG: hypothetical protein OEY90_07575 [Candidatus Bathyarchaeota archaeon]|nr:hypothetical protein [Candidatus Bathyarchaeota archaeon]